MRLGQLVMTRRVNRKIVDEPAFLDDITAALGRYTSHDWGDTCEEDAKLNGIEGERILAVYPTVLGQIWIITEWDRSVTTVLFPEEY